MHKSHIYLEITQLLFQITQLCCAFHGLPEAVQEPQKAFAAAVSHIAKDYKEYWRNVGIEGLKQKYQYRSLQKT